MTIPSGAFLRKTNPKGMPISDETTSRQAALMSALRQAVERMLTEMVNPSRAMSGGAVRMLTPIKASSGIATSASPKPMAERVKVPVKTIASIATVCNVVI